MDLRPNKKTELGILLVDFDDFGIFLLFQLIR